jgi:hypothetical protein
MPPLYTWQDEKTGKEVTVVRSVEEIEIAPTEEESGVKDGRWKRLLCACTFKRGPNWTGSKGNW